MKNWLIAIIIPTVLSCSMIGSDNNASDEDFYRSTYGEKKEIDSMNLPRHAINDVVKGLAYQMLNNSSFVNLETPVSVASFVDLNDLESTNWLGNQLSESFVHELQRHGLVVVDFKATGHIRVTKEGDYVFSRDWQELPERQIIDYIVTGTMMPQEDGVIVNARMIGMKSHVVVATAQSFIPAWVVGDDIKRKADKTNGVTMKDGMLIRVTDADKGVSIQK